MGRPSSLFTANETSTDLNQAKRLSCNMVAEIVSVGTEILLGQITDSNAVELGKAFAFCGVDHRHRQTVGDNLPRLVSTIRLALSRADIVITIGGLGPTEDDITRQGIAEALGDTLVVDADAEAHLRAVFEKRRLPWLDSQLQQAMRPTCAEIIPNPNGTAPGIVCKKDGKIVIAMPGPRVEFVPMLESHVQPLLGSLSGGVSIVSKTLRVIGIGESIVEEKLRDLMQASNPTVAPYAKTGEVHIRLTTKASTREAGLELLQPTEKIARERLGDAIYGVENETLESVVVNLLLKRGLTIAVAESCTGGMLGQRLTTVSGSSEAFLGGVISYSNEAKIKMLGVPKEVIEQHGAVSEECAREMVKGVQSQFGSDLAVSITGIAGPGGGSEEKPVGLVYIGVANGNLIDVYQNLFPGTRETVRTRSTQIALMQLRKAIL